MADDEDVVTETLYVHRCVHLYKIPPRPAAGGHRSGEWLVADKIFSGRLRMVAKGELAEVRLEEADGELFAMCPVEFGRRAVCVEPVSDSSRYFVLRVADPASGRHAFLGLGFDERGDAFDFSAALSDHERRIQREHDAAAAAAGGGAAAGAAAAAPRPGGASPVDSGVAVLYQHHGDLGLKEGQTIKVEIKKVGSRPHSASGGGGGGFMQRAAALPLAPLAPPPAGTVGPAPVLAPPPGAPAAAAAPAAGFEDSAAWGAGRQGSSAGGAAAAAPPRRSGNPFDSDDPPSGGEGGGGESGGGESGGATVRVSQSGGGGGAPEGGWAAF